MNAHEGGAGMRHGIFAEQAPESHWLAGLVAADGSVKGDRAWTLSQSGDEGRATIERVRTLTGHRLTVSERTPLRGRTAHVIYVPSRQMVADLQRQYGIGPRKTLTYTWPGLNGAAAADFLAGYIDGDGCVGEYRTPKGEPFLHISFVGTTEFMANAVTAIPADGKLHRLSQCKNLAEVRYSGRHAWAAGAWLYASPTAQESRKYRAYEAHVTTARPAWKVMAERRERVRQALDSGLSLRATAAATGEHLGTVCAWKKQFTER
ncbi:hypothetical protein ACIQMV_08575 [Streptomyces sp. NPDC091412]|uniref:hypothetical protein n=1 Tax=Streptomyces sp. NPDC091412 TaxID=3366002 RepID=UPI00382073F3